MDNSIKPQKTFPYEKILSINEQKNVRYNYFSQNFLREYLRI